MRISPKDGFAALSLVAMVFLVYWQTGEYGLVNLDDYEYLVRSKAITGGFSAGGVAWAWKTVEHSIWMPLTWMSYMFDFTAFGPDCWGAMHLHSTAIHAINAILVYLVLRLVLPENEHGVALLAFAGAAFWAWHPLRVESVAWLSSRKDVLSFMFESVAVVCWIMTGRRKELDGRFALLYMLSIGAFGIGALAKPSVMTFPILVGALDVFIFRRLRPKCYILPGIMMLVIAIEASVAQTAGGATKDLSSVPLWARLLNAMSAYGVYLTNTVWPADLAPQCMSRYPGLPRALGCGVILSAAAAGYLGWRGWKIWQKRENPLKERLPPDYFAAGLIWFSLGIAPFLGIANFGYHAFCDRFTYIPAVGLSLILLAWIGNRRRLGGGLLTLVVALMMSYLSHGQCGIWESDRKVWSKTLAVDGDRNAIAHQGLGLASFEFEHDLKAACREFKKVRELREGIYFLCAQQHIYSLCELGKTEEAEDVLLWYKRAMVKYRQANQRVDQTIYGSFELPVRLSNFEHSQIAVALCDPKQRNWAREEIEKRVEQTDMTPSLAYLMYRYGVVTENNRLKDIALEELRRAEKFDSVQYRFLTPKVKQQ